MTKDILDLINFLFKGGNIYYLILVSIISAFSIIWGYFKPITSLTAGSVEEKFFTKEKGSIISFIKSLKYLPIIIDYAIALLFFSVLLRGSWIVNNMIKYGMVFVLMYIFFTFSITLIIVWQSWQMTIVNGQREYSKIAAFFYKLSPQKKWSKLLINLAVVVFQFFLVLICSALYIAFFSSKIYGQTNILIFDSIFSLIISLFFPVLFKNGVNLLFSLHKDKEYVWIYFDHKKWYVNNIFQKEFFLLSNSRDVKKSDSKMLLRKEEIANKELHIET